MITFTRNIELFKASKDKNFEIFIGTIPNSYGLSIKIVRTSKEIKYSKNLVNPANGLEYEGYYSDRYFYTFAIRKLAFDNNWHFIKSKVKTQLPKTQK